MLSKRAGSFLVLLPVLVFAQWRLPASGPRIARGASQSQDGLQGALPLRASWAVRPGPPVATSAVLALGQNGRDRGLAIRGLDGETALIRFS